MSDPTSYTEAFSKFVPGFEFLQGLVKNAGQTLPNIGQWVAPTLDPAELERRIHELRTVQFWLEQNARMIGTTVQALEVQRMTLGTLQRMNVPMGDLGEVLKVRSMADMFQSAAPAVSPAPAPTPAPAPAPAPAASTASTAPDGAAAPAVDPVQWWGALTQQFTELATQAMQATSDATAEAQARAAEALKATAEAAAAAAQAPSAPPAPPAPAPKAPARKSAARKSPARKSAKG